MPWSVEDFKLIDAWAPKGAPMAIGAMITDDQGRLLMQLRDNKSGLVGAGQWALFGGHIDDGETLEVALIREIHEELGIMTQASQFTPFARNVNSTGGLNLIVLTMITPVDSISIHLAEGAGFGFFDRTQLPSLNVADSIRPFIDEWLSARRTDS